VPAVVEASSSLLLMETGWARCRIRGRTQLFGIDRFGKTTARAAQIAASADVKEIFVGTSRGCGSFAETTNLLSADGTRINIGEIVRAGSIAEQHFEHVVRTTKAQLTEFASVWEDLAREAAAVTDRRVILRCRADAQSSVALGNTRKIGARWYFSLSKDEAERAMDSDPRKVFDALFSCFQIDGTAAVLRDSTALLAFFCASLDEQARSHVVKYDALQHTALVFVVPGETPRGVLADGRSVQTTGRTVSSYTIDWDDSSWRPLVNGILVTP
jgi:hypothetical protein